MHLSASRMRRMILDLLELSRVNTQGRPFEWVNLTTIAQEVLSDLEIQVNRTAGKVVLEALPKIQADPGQMHQLLQNLIGNALTNHPPGVPPEVRIYARPAAANQVEICVQDNGIGFETSNLERIFQPFQRLVGRSQYEGTGIGLAICRKIVERHQGSITAESTPGQGATFIIQLPVRAKTPSPALAD